MIAGLLHGRLLGGGGGGPAVVSVLGFMASYTASDYNFYGGTARIYLDINPDGTWEVRDQDGPRHSGNWYAPAAGGIGAGYEVRITAALGAGSGGTINNPAAAFTSIAAQRTLTLELAFSGTAGGDRQRAIGVAVDIRLAAGAIVSTGSFTANLDAGSTGGG